MKKFLAYRTLQITAAIAVYTAASVWASENHVEIVSQMITRINSLLVILAIAFVFPYICFKALSKLYTPPLSRDLDDSKSATDSVDNIQNEFDETWETMQYRGNRYKPEDLEIKSSNAQIKQNTTKSVIKYRGAIINSDQNEGATSAEVSDNLSKECQPQKSAQPKERMKYRGSYID
ncbi:MAG: hypothetical protein IM537_11325 [Pseudanabaena sp. M57BS1SP1A06MG]|jgi:hypothetical protein|uniref:hypothetical protein n=1 Tax=Pseudanabaena mucicola TaxID=71190 RepID=UPI002578B495|nr:hypothetical protein [Pseudanabaena mucicola]MCA6575196.1 hypothetical protein [Pseudanabaena sp. M53BS1SP1A06MG]MCA6583320.1 hypothetical protein [Pseudanabaena sp. M34BS1SP1A06MG]MCA6593798.1 hypothetical protein [Pseudanabaena sp. M38BS1SP1A06MG]MCA6600774.1 hypothetical protein [Pseudanabaena sp. M57BS1SP1A06MG]